MSFDNSDLQQIEAAEEMARLRISAEREMLRDVLSTFAGRRVIYNVMTKAQIYGDIMSTDVAEVNRFLGRRSVGLEVLAEMSEVDPDVYMLMQRENAEFEDKYVVLVEEEG